MAEAQISTAGKPSSNFIAEVSSRQGPHRCSVFYISVAKLGEDRDDKVIKNLVITRGC